MLCSEEIARLRVQDPGHPAQVPLAPAQVPLAPVQVPLDPVCFLVSGGTLGRHVDAFWNPVGRQGYFFLGFRRSVSEIFCV